MRKTSPRRTTSPRASMGGSSSPAAVPERMRRAAGEAAQHLSSTSGLAGADDWVKVPRNVASHHALKLEMDMQQQSCEKILCDELILLKKMLLKHQASGMNHDAGTVEEFIETRAQQSIDEDLDVIISDLVQVKGTHPHHRITAYAQLFAALNAELQSLVFTKDRQRVADMQGKVKSQQEAHRAEAAKLNLSVATKQKEVELLLAEKEDLRIKCAAAEAEALHWKRELGKTGRSQEQAHQDMVELRMQGIDFKSEVNRRSLKVLHSIQSRMGFVPSGVQKQVLLLNMLRAPGDPLYDEVRRAKATDREKFLSSTFYLPDTGLGSGLGAGLGAEPPMSFIDLIGKKLVDGGISSRELESPNSFSNSNGNSRTGSPGRPLPATFPRSISQGSSASADTSSANDTRRRSSTSTSSTIDTRRTTFSSSPTEDFGTLDRANFVGGGENVADLAQENRTIGASPEQELMHNSFGELEDDDDGDDFEDAGDENFFTDQDCEDISSDIKAEFAAPPPVFARPKSAQAGAVVSDPLVHASTGFIRKPPPIAVNSNNSSPPRVRSCGNLLVKSAIPKQKKGTAGKRKASQQPQQQFAALAKPKERFTAGTSSAPSVGAPRPLPSRARKSAGGASSPCPVPISAPGSSARAATTASPYRIKNSSPRLC